MVRYSGGAAKVWKCLSSRRRRRFVGRSCRRGGTVVFVSRKRGSDRSSRSHELLRMVMRMIERRGGRSCDDRSVSRIGPLSSMLCTNNKQKSCLLFRPRRRSIATPGCLRCYVVAYIKCYSRSIRRTNRPDSSSTDVSPPFRSNEKKVSAKLRLPPMKAAPVPIQTRSPSTKLVGQALWFCG